jgi:hypothetical protein
MAEFAINFLSVNSFVVPSQNVIDDFAPTNRVKVICGSGIAYASVSACIFNGTDTIVSLTDSVLTEPCTLAYPGGVTSGYGGNTPIHDHSGPDTGGDSVIGTPPRFEINESETGIRFQDQAGNWSAWINVVSGPPGPQGDPGPPGSQGEQGLPGSSSGGGPLTEVAFAGTWQTYTAYQAGHIISNIYKIYICVLAHISQDDSYPGVYPDTQYEGDFWEEVCTLNNESSNYSRFRGNWTIIGEGTPYKQAGDDPQSVTYNGAQWVFHNNGLYSCILSHSSATTNEPGIGIDWETYWAQEIDFATWAYLFA